MPTNAAAAAAAATAAAAAAAATAAAAAAAAAAAYDISCVDARDGDKNGGTSMAQKLTTNLPELLVLLYVVLSFCPACLLLGCCRKSFS